MKYDHIVKASENLKAEQFHLSCGFYDTTWFFFEKAELAVDIHCEGVFTFRTADRKVIKQIKASPMKSGRGCYMDVLITTEGDAILFQLPEYDWIDHYPNCDGESDRWDARIIGVRDEIRWP